MKLSQASAIPTSLFITYLIANSASATSLQGYVSNPPTLCKQIALPDKRCPLLKGKVKTTTLRGLIGIQFNAATGELLYLYPECSLNSFGIHTGDMIIKIEKEAYRPCLLPGISAYPIGFIMQLTIQTKTGIKVVPVKLIDARRFTSGDS